MSSDMNVTIKAERLMLRMHKPVKFGELVISERPSCVVTATLSSGIEGRAFTLDRGGPLCEIVTGVLAPRYESVFEGDPASCWDACLASHHPVLSAGVGLRALSIVDIAVYDALSREAGTSVAEYVNASGPPPPLYGIVGYPPTSGPKEIEAEVAAAIQSGVVGVKLPIAGSVKETRARAFSAIEAADGLPVAIDLAWSMQSAEEAARLVEGLDLEWVEDPFVPGNTSELVRLRSMLDVPLASGDEESHLYHPEVFLEAEAVDIVRMDATCQGGVTRVLRLAEILPTYGVPVSWHMNTFVHRQLGCLKGITTKSVEISSPGSGVDLLAERLVVDSRKLFPQDSSDDVRGWGVTSKLDVERPEELGWAAYSPS